MAEREIGMARVMLSKRAADVGEVLFSRIPVKSESDYRCILEGVLDLQQAKELSEDIRQHQLEPRGEAAGYTWRR